MRFEILTKPHGKNWRLEKSGDFASPIWSDWEREHLTELLNSGNKFLRLNNMLFNKVEDTNQ